MITKEIFTNNNSWVSALVIPCCSSLIRARYLCANSVIAALEFLNVESFCLLKTSYSRQCLVFERISCNLRYMKHSTYSHGPCNQVGLFKVANSAFHASTTPPISSFKGLRQSELRDNYLSGESFSTSLRSLSTCIMISSPSFVCSGFDVSIVSWMSFITFSRIAGHLFRDVVYPKLFGSPVDEMSKMSDRHCGTYQHRYPSPKTL